MPEQEGAGPAHKPPGQSTERIGAFVDAVLASRFVNRRPA
jgi:hypothetical protein